MARIQFVDYRGKRVLSADYSNLRPEEVMKAIEEAKDVLKKEPAGSVLTLTNVENTFFNTDLLNHFNSFMSNECNTYIKAGAVIGIKGIQKIAYDTIMKFSKTKMPTFEDKQKALDWLVDQ